VDPDERAVGVVDPQAVQGGGVVSASGRNRARRTKASGRCPSDRNLASVKAFSGFAVDYRDAPLPEDAGPIDRPAAIRQVEALLQGVRRLLPAMESRAE